MIIDIIENDIIITYSKDEIEELKKRFEDFKKDIFSGIDFFSDEYLSWGMCWYIEIINTQKIAVSTIKKTLDDLQQSSAKHISPNFNWSKTLNNNKYYNYNEFPITWDIAHICFPKHIIKLLF